MSYDVVLFVNKLVAEIHLDNVDAGWWNNLETGEPIEATLDVVLAKIMLIVTELAEAVEGQRKNLADDKLPHRPMIEVELADAIIRICDLAGKLGLDIGGAMQEKRAFNKVREDHKISNRLLENGKKC